LVHFPAEATALQQQRNFLPSMLQDLATVQKQTNAIQDRSENNRIYSNGNSRSHSDSGLLSPNLEFSRDTWLT